ncbi:hypothetical protein [Halorhodospira halophila]|uniref:hypothetical protein n=1 Tax=Halorhodospira halophila TaxID=1053 RepID=UPI001913A8FF|nr:hypothetical protein [Halorhodospira halophila]MBK5944834.1 hypothetical protein [Halorhodospira halophila]
MTTITTKDDLYRCIEAAFGSDAPSQPILARLTDDLWGEGHDEGYRSGNDWSAFLADIDLVERAEAYFQQADELTKEMRSALGYGSVEYAEANGEFVIWPLGEPYGTAEEVRNKIDQLTSEAP